MTHKYLYPEDIRERLLDLDIPGSLVYRTLGIKKSWWNKAFIPNEAYRLQEPSQERLRRIWAFLDDFEQLQKQYAEASDSR